MLSWNQVPVEVTFEQHLPPPPERPFRHRLSSKPGLLRPERLQMILMHHLPDLIRAETPGINWHGYSFNHKA
jgi:hypothetical protein